MRRLGLVPLILMTATACENSAAPVLPESTPAFAISDAIHGSGNSRFYFLSPMVKNPAVSGIFDPNVNAAVRICAWTGTACGAELATYTRATGPGGQVISVDPTVGAYMVRWLTRDFAVDPGQVYRIRVLGGMQELGFADVQVVLNNREAKNVNTGEFIPLVDGHILNIRFRIEQDALSFRGATLAAGESQTCGISTNGSTYCWGNNGYGELGNGTVPPNTAIIPTLVAGGITFNAVAAGRFHTCGLSTLGDAYCWGWNILGQIGTGTTADATVPTAVIGGLKFSALAVGQYHSCGLTPTGAAYCWGQSDDGNTAITTPTAVPGGITFAAITAGGIHNCGLTVSGAAYCWGNNTYGAGGTGTTDWLVAPTLVSGGHTFASLAAGQVHTCGITLIGDAYCWGINQWGQLGSESVAVDDFTATPALVSGGLSFVALTATDDVTCGITTIGTAYCWGVDDEQQLGAVPHPDDYGASTPVPVTGGHTFVSLAAGRGHTCGLTGGGLAYCWGFGPLMGIGVGVGYNTPIPMAVSGNLVFKTQ